MKIDTHVHSSGISKCSKVTIEDIVKYKKLQGVDGVILTNHVQPWYYEKDEYRDFIKEYVKEFENAFQYGKKNNFKFFEGVEVTINIPHYADFLLFGVTNKFLLSSPDLCALTQEELYNLCKENDIILIQAHPLREKHILMDTNLLDGIEINLRPSDYSREEEIVKIGKENNLLITAGTDYHSITQDLSGGLIIPDEIENSVEIADYIRKCNGTTVFVGDRITNYKKI